jgi:phage gpG-like protein
MLLQVDGATKAAAEEAANLLRETITGKLTEKSHEKGTPTPSAPGQPPAAITRRLAESVTVDSPVVKGFGDYAVAVGPHTEYARIQEDGGDTGRGHLTRLPPRPYMAPSMREAAPLMEAIFAERLKDTIVL